MSFARVALRLRQPIARQTGLRASFAQYGPARRAMSSAAAHQPKSDTPWQIGSVVGVVGGLALIYGSGSDKTHAKAHEEKHSEKKEEPEAEAKETEASASEPAADSEVSEDDVSKSINQGLSADAPKVAKAAEESGETPAQAEPTTADPAVAESTQQAIESDVPKEAKAAEESSSPAPTSSEGETSKSEPSEGDFVEVTKEEIAESIQQALESDTPKAAKAAEEK